MKYRILFYFYRKYGSLMEYAGPEEFLEEFGMDGERLEAY